MKKIIKKDEKEALVAIASFKKEQKAGKLKKVQKSISEFI